MSEVSCPRRHRLVRFEVVSCQIHGSHRVYLCPMWAGRRRCAEQVAVPPLGPRCAE